MFAARAEFSCTLSWQSPTAGGREPLQLYLANFKKLTVHTQAKETFAKREEFQLHILVAHPPQMALENGPGANRDGAIILDGKVQDKAAIFFGPSTVRGKHISPSCLHVPCMAYIEILWRAQTALACIGHCP